MITSEKCKVILLGEPGVGKTSIIERFVDRTFKGTTMATIGSSYSTTTFTMDNGMVYVLDIWDTAGIETYRSINKIFYRDALIAILVYDITNRRSFDQLKEYWIKEIKKETGNKISKIKK